MANDEDLPTDPADRERIEALRRTIRRKSLRHERARRHRRPSVLSYLGTFGLVGWTVTIPTLAGLAFGLYIDSVVESERSFTIVFMLLGVAIGLVTAWYWIQQEGRGHDR